MHGSEQCIEKFRASRRSAPPRPLSLPQDQCLPAHRSLSSQRSRPLVTAFPSPATAAPSQKLPFQGQRSRPATSWPAGWFYRPVRPLLPRLHWFAPGEGSFFAQARCGFARRLAGLLPLSPLPSGTFISLGIEAFNRFRRLAARLPNSPDFLSLPAAGSISSVDCGSTFQDRYVSGSRSRRAAPARRRTRRRTAWRCCPSGRRA